MNRALYKLAAPWRAVLSIKLQKKKQGKNNENTEKISNNHVITFNSYKYNLYFN